MKIGTKKLVLLNNISFFSFNYNALRIGARIAHPEAGEGVEHDGLVPAFDGEEGVGRAEEQPRPAPRSTRDNLSTPSGWGQEARASERPEKMTTGGWSGRTRTQADGLISPPGGGCVSDPLQVTPLTTFLPDTHPTTYPPRPKTLSPMALGDSLEADSAVTKADANVPYDAKLPRR